MKIVLRSKVKEHYESVYQRFDQQLFEYLLPTGAQLIQFGGSKPGDKVEILFGFPLKGRWVSEITEEEHGNDFSLFIDVGTALPFGLKSWHHTHKIKKCDEQSSIIEDHMEFSTGNRLLDLIYYPGLYLAFLPRVWQYKKYFKNLNKI